VIAETTSRIQTKPLRPRPLSDRLRAWANVSATVGQHLDDPPAALRILAEGVRRVMETQYAALLVSVAPGILEVRAISGIDLDQLARIENNIDHPLVGWQMELLGGPVANAYLEHRDALITQASSIPNRNPFQPSDSTRAVWILPLALAPDEDCVGIMALGLSTGEPPSDDDRAFAVAFMAQVAVAVKNAQLYELERSRREREQRLRALAEAQQKVTASVGTGLELSSVADKVLATLTQLIPCDTASLFMRYGDVMRVSAIHNLPEETLGAEYALAWPLSEQMVATRKPVWLADVQADVRVVAIPAADRVRGWLAAPFVIGERIIGQVSLGSFTPNVFNEEDAELLEALAHQAALALENSQLYTEATRRLQQMATLNEISSAAIFAFDFDEVLKRLAAALRRTLRYESLALWMVTDSDGGHLLKRVESVPSGDDLAPETASFEPVQWGQGLVGRVAASGQALWVTSPQSENDEPVVPSPETPGSQLCVPVRTNERVIGVIDVRSQRYNAFNETDVHLLSVVAGQMARALESARLYAAERRRTEETLVLLDVAEAISSSFDLTDMLNTAARRTAQVCRVDMCIVLLLDADDSHFKLAGRAVSPDSAYTLDWIGFNTILQDFEVSDTPRMMETLTVGQPRVVSASELSGPLWQFFTGETPLNMLLLVPLRVSDRSLGLMILGNFRLHDDFDARQVSLTAAIGRQLAVAVDALQLREVETERTGYLGVLYQVSRSISATLDPDAVLSAAVREIVVRFPYSLASILIMDSAHGELEQRAAAGLSSHLIPVGYRHPINTGLIGHVARTGQTYVSNNVDTDPYFTRTYEAETGAELVVPLKREGRVIGVLNLEKPSGGRFLESEIMAMETLAGQVAAALENAYLYARTSQTVKELSDSLEQLKQTQVQLVQSAKLAAVGQLAAGVAHEINNPLTTISGFSELLLGELPEDSPLHNDLTMIRRESQRARDVVRRLLDFARQSGPHREPADLNDVVRETVTLMKNAAITKSVNVLELYAPDLPWARMDVNQIKQVVLNLLNNAVQAMPKGGTLTVATEYYDIESPGLRLRLADTGIGIPRENLERVFEPFFTTKPPGEGTGLGLALSYTIVRDHGGRIEVNSVVNKGTTFVVWLPIKDELTEL
jgi:GAF domain-containing protein